MGRVNNVDYSLLRSTPKLYTAFTERVKSAIAASAGPKVKASDVDLEIIAGSVIIKAHVKPPQGVAAKQITEVLAETKGQVTEKVTSSIQKVEGIESITSGTPSTTFVSVTETLVSRKEEAVPTNQEQESKTRSIAVVIGASLGVLLVCAVGLSILACLWCGRSGKGSELSASKSESNPNIDMADINPALEADHVDVKMVEP